MDPEAGAISLLWRVGWFSSLPEAVRAALGAVARVRRCAADEVLFVVGDPPGGLYGLESGCLAIEAAQSDSAPQKSLLVHPGAWIGEGSIIGRESRMIGVWATRPSIVLAIGLAALRRVAIRSPELWRHIACLSLENHGRTIGLAQDLMLRGSRERLTALLARLAGLRDAHPPARPMVDATQSEIAAIANLSRGVVSALLLDMERAGLVSLRRAGVEILDAGQLLRAASAASQRETP